MSFKTVDLFQQRPGIAKRPAFATGSLDNCLQFRFSHGSISYRLRFREHLGSELRWQVGRSQQIDVDTEQ